MAVNIEVNLNKIDTRDIAKIEAQLASIGDGVDFDFDDIIDGDFDDLGIDIDSDDLDLGSMTVANGGEDDTSLSDIKTELKRINGTILGTSSSSGGGSSGDDDSGIDIKKHSVPSNLRDKRNLIPLEKRMNLDIGSVPDSGRDVRNRISKSFLQKAPTSGLASPKSGSRFDILGSGRHSVRLNNLKNKLDGVTAAGGRLGSVLSRLKPSMGKIYTIMATILPVAAGLAVQLGAVAVAMGSLIVPAAAIGVLGALGGEADSLEGSMAQASARMEDFKKELFQTVEPVADLFGPIVDRFLDSMVQKVGGLTDELASFRAFEGVLFDGLDGGMRMLENLFQQITMLRPVISRLSRSAGGFIASALPEFFRDTVIEADKTSDTLAKAGDFIWQVLRLVYELLKAIVAFTASLAGLAPILKVITKILGNRWVQIIAVLIGLFASLFGILYGLAGAVKLLAGMATALNTALLTQGSILGVLQSMWAGSWIASAVGSISALISWVWSLNSALATTAGLVTIATAGLAAIAGGAALTAGAVGAIGDIYSGGGGNGGQTVNNVTMNFEGDMDNASRNKMVDVSKGVLHEDNLSSGNFGATR